jgi:hypothetical protein
MSKQVQLRKNTSISKCPKCGNNTRFHAHSVRGGEDFCELFVVCKCGYDPSSDVWGHRVESVMGELSRFNIEQALFYGWNAAIEDLATKSAQSSALCPPRE